MGVLGVRVLRRGGAVVGGVVLDRFENSLAGISMRMASVEGDGGDGGRLEEAKCLDMIFDVGAPEATRRPMRCRETTGECVQSLAQEGCGKEGYSSEGKNTATSYERTRVVCCTVLGTYILSLSSWLTTLEQTASNARKLKKR